MGPDTPLLTRACAIACNRLVEQLTLGLDRLPADLEAQQYASHSGEERRILARAIEEIRPARAAFPEEFSRAFTAAFERKLRGASPAAGAEPTLDDLTLVDDAAIELEIALGRLVRKTADELDSDDFYGIEARVGELVCGELLESSRNPLGVEVAMEGLRVACDLAAQSGPVRMALANGLQPYVAAGLRQAYREVNGLLAAAGIQSRLKYHVARAESIASPHAGSPAGDAPMALSQPINLRDLLPVAAGGPVDIGAIVAALLAGAPERRRAGARILSNPDGVLYRAAVATPADPALLELLARRREPAPDADPEPLDGLATHARHPLDRLTLDLVARVFDFLREDRDVPDAVKAELGRLSFVAIEAALVDRTVFASERHPLRRFLAQACAAAADPETDTSPGGPFLRTLQDVVSALVRAGGRDAAAFESAAARLREAAQEAGYQRRAEVAAAAESIEHAERYEVAFAQATAEVAARVAERQPPAFVADFLEGPWVEAIARAEAARHAGADGPDRRLALVDDLLWSVAPDGAADGKALAAMLPGLVGALRRALPEVLDEDAAQAFLDSLMRRHAELLQLLQRAAPAPDAAVKAQQARPGQAEATLPYKAAMPPVLPPLVARGTLVEISESGAATRARLAWVSPLGATYLFTSRGSAARVLRRDEVARMLSAGELRAVEAPPLAVERAFAAVSR